MNSGEIHEYVPGGVKNLGGEPYPACLKCGQTSGHPTHLARPIEVWAVLERLGHNRTAGRLTEEEKFGGKMGRLDVPQRDGKFMTIYFTHSVVYGLTVVGEAEARAVAGRASHRPVEPWEMPPPSENTKAIGPATASQDDAQEIDTYDYDKY